MQFLLAFLLLIALTAPTLSAQRQAATVPPTTLLPTLSCWFLSYSGPTGGATNPQQPRTLHLVLGYENQATTNQVIHVQRQAALGSAPKNIITPADYNGQQPEVFKVGAHSLVLDLGDVRNVIRTRSHNVTWLLGAARLVVTHTSLTAENRCDTRYANHCPVKMTGFCEDGLYCNGRETCTANFVYTAAGQEQYGACRAAVAPPTCREAQFCSERAMNCVDLVARAPATSSIASAAVKAADVCIHDTDCALFDSFCNGTSTCVNYSCTYDSNYSACPVTSECTEAGCLTSPSYCTSDADCSATVGTFCQGNTSCQSNHCRFNITYTPCGPGEVCQVDQCVAAPTGNATGCTSDAQCASLGSFCLGNATCGLDGQCALPANYTPCAATDLCTSQGCVAANTTTCVNQSDCAGLTSFCRGPATCSTTDGLCLYNASYVACPPAVPLNATDYQGGILATVCSEEQMTCLTYYYCLVDSDCDDGKFCTGTETCVAGSCHYGAPVVCTDGNHTCSEAYHCGDVLLSVPTSAPPTTAAPTSSPNNNTAILVFSIVFGVLVLVLLLVLILYFIWSQSVKQQASYSSAVAQGGMATRLNNYGRRK